MPWGTFVRPKMYSDLGYRAKDLAEAFGVCVRTIYRLEKAGRIAGFRVNRAVIYPSRSLKVLLNAGLTLKL